VETNPVTETDILHGYPWKPEKQGKYQQWYLHKFSGVGENGCIPLDNLIFI